MTDKPICYDCNQIWDGWCIWPEHHRPPRSKNDMVYLCYSCCVRRGLTQKAKDEKV